MTYNYKTYNKDNKTWIYGEKEVIVNQKDLSKSYFIVNNDSKYQVEEESICEITPLMSNDKKPIYEKDIISINFQDNLPTIFTVLRGECKLSLDLQEDVIFHGLYLKDSNNKDYVFSDKIIKNPENIRIIGNILENHNN